MREPLGVLNFGGQGFEDFGGRPLPDGGAVPSRWRMLVLSAPLQPHLAAPCVTQAHGCAAAMRIHSPLTPPRDDASRQKADGCMMLSTRCVLRAA